MDIGPGCNDVPGLCRSVGQSPIPMPAGRLHNPVGANWPYDC
jgi:hypothetical protein